MRIKKIEPHLFFVNQKIFSSQPELLRTCMRVLAHIAEFNLDICTSSF